MSPHFGVVQETLVRSVYTRQRHAYAREAPRDSSLVGTVRVGVFRGKEEEVVRIARGPALPIARLSSVLWPLIGGSNVSFRVPMGPVKPGTISRCCGT